MVADGEARQSLAVALVDVVAGRCVRAGVAVVRELAPQAPVAERRRDLQLGVEHVDRVLYEHAFAGRDRAPVAALVARAVGVLEQVAAEPDVGDVAGVVHGHGRLGLAVARALVPDATADLVVVEHVGQCGGDAGAVRVGQAAAVDEHGVEAVAVTVEVTDAAVQLRLRSGCRRGLEVALGQQSLLDPTRAVTAPEVGHDFKAQAIGQREVGLGRHEVVLERVQRVAEILRIGVGVDLRARAGRTVLRHNRREIGVVAVGGPLRLVEGREVVVDGAVVKHARTDLVARAQVVLGAEIDVLAVGAAVALPLVGLRQRCRHERLEVAELAGIDPREGAEVAQLAARQRDARALLVFGRARPDADVAAHCADVRRIGVGSALRDVERAQVFLVDVLLREDSEVARVVDRRAVDREAHLVAVEAAHPQAAAEQAGRVLAGAVHAGQQRQRLERVTAGAGLLELGLADRTARFGRVFVEQQPRAQLVALAGHDDLVQFGGRLGVGRAEHGEHGQGDGVEREGAHEREVLDEERTGRTTNETVSSRAASASA